MAEGIMLTPQKVHDYLALLRPHQWVKNGLLFAGYIFAGNFKKPPPQALMDFLFAALATLSFCLLAGGVYAFNDIRDREKDRHHPLKRNRPVASGRVSVSEASVIALGSIGVGLTLAALLTSLNDTSLFLLTAFVYPLWGLTYSFWFKEIVIVDALGVATGFVLRVVAGCLAVKVAISPWLILCTLLIALFIAFCKRRHELLSMGDDAVTVRSVLPRYTPQLLDQFIAITAAMTLMAYSLYTFTAPHILLGDRKEPWLMLTIPFVVYGVFRFLYLAYRTDIGGTPELMVRDRPLMLNLFLWVLTVLFLGWLAR